MGGHFRRNLGSVKMNTRLILILASMAINSNVKATDHYNDAYMFGYEVNSNEYEQKQNFGQMEHRNEDEVMGEWYVQLPDGRVQRVRYYVDKYSGFVAEVTYEASVPKYDRMNDESVPRKLPRFDGFYH